MVTHTGIQRHLIVEGRHRLGDLLLSINIILLLISFANSRGQVDCSKLEELLGNETTPQVNPTHTKLIIINFSRLLVGLCIV